jgi:inner membrane protein
MDLFGFLAGISPWMWIALGVALGAVEMATMSFFLIWPGLAAVAVGVVLWLVPDLSGNAQVALFAVLAVAATLAGRAAIRRGGQAPSDRPDLNRRSERMAGRIGVALEPFLHGEGAVEIDGLRWRARLAADAGPLEAGAPVRVLEVNGMTLTVVPASSSASTED